MGKKTSSGMWVPVVLGETPKETYKLVSHGPWVTLGKTGKSYCKKCGLVNLRNPLTEWCIAKGCDYDLHTQYANRVRNSSTTAR